MTKDLFSKSAHLNLKYFKIILVLLLFETQCRLVLNQLSLAVPCNGTEHLWWMAQCSSASWWMAMASPGRGQSVASPRFPAPPQTCQTAAGSGLSANGADSSAPSRMAATSPRPRSTVASFRSQLFFSRSSTTASGSHWRSLLLPAARSPQNHDPPQQRGLSDSVSLLSSWCSAPL